MATGVERLEAIVLAAGAGSRFGGGKLTAPFGGGRLIDGALAAALAAPVRGVTLITGADTEVAYAVEGRAVRIVHAADHALGMAHSLRAGLASLPPDTAGAFVFLGDMPRVPPAILPLLAAKLAQGFDAAAPLHPRGRGHPVLIGQALFMDIMGLEGDRGARALLDGLGPRLALVPTDDDGVLLDIDRPEDLTALEPRPAGR